MKHYAGKTEYYEMLNIKPPCLLAAQECNIHCTCGPATSVIVKKDDGYTRLGQGGLLCSNLMCTQCFMYSDSHQSSKVWNDVTALNDGCKATVGQ